MLVNWPGSIGHVDQLVGWKRSRILGKEKGYIVRFSLEVSVVKFIGWNRCVDRCTSFDIGNSGVHPGGAQFKSDIAKAHGWWISKCKAGRARRVVRTRCCFRYRFPLKIHRKTTTCCRDIATSDLGSKFSFENTTDVECLFETNKLFAERFGKEGRRSTSQISCYILI